MGTWGGKGLAALALATTFGVGFATARLCPSHESALPPPGHALYTFRVATPSPTSPGLEQLERRVASFSPPSAFDLAELAGLYLERGRNTADGALLDKAEKTAKQSLAALKSPNPARLVLARLACERHDFRGALELAQAALKERGSASAVSVLVTANLALGRLAEASRLADELVDSLPTSGSYFLRALVNEAQGRDAEAALDFESAARREEPGNVLEAARLRTLWGRFYLRRGRLGEARTLVTEALRLAPTSPLVLGIAGELSLRHGRAAEAAERFMAAFSIARQTRYLVFYARARERSGDTRAADEARAQAEKFLRPDLQAGRYGHRLELVELLLDRAKPEDVAEAVKLAEAELTVRESTDAHYALARGYVAARRFDDAARAMRAALRTGVRSPELYAWASRIERERGRPAQAELYARLARPNGDGLTVSAGDLN